MRVRFSDRQRCSLFFLNTWQRSVSTGFLSKLFAPSGLFRFLPLFHMVKSPVIRSFQFFIRIITAEQRHFCTLNEKRRSGNFISFHIIYPLTVRVLGAPQMISQPVSSFWDSENSRPVHSLMLSSHLFLSLSCLLPPFTVPCNMVLARPDERETWPYHCRLRLFTLVRRSSCGPIACWTLARTSFSLFVT